MLAIAGNVIPRCGRNIRVLGYPNCFRKKRCVESGFQGDLEKREVSSLAKLELCEYRLAKYRRRRFLSENRMSAPIPISSSASTVSTPRAYNFEKNQMYHVPAPSDIPKCVMKYLLDKQKSAISTCPSPKDWIMTYELRTGQDLAPWLLSYGYDISRNMTGSTAKSKKSRRSRKQKKSLRKVRRPLSRKV